jgi:hypothetical protein
MSEVSSEVKVVQTHYVCDCRRSYYEPTGITDTKVTPALYQHRCGACGDVKVFEKIYPYIEYI